MSSTLFCAYVDAARPASHEQFLACGLPGSTIFSATPAFSEERVDDDAQCGTNATRACIAEGFLGRACTSSPVAAAKADPEGSRSNGGASVLCNHIGPKVAASPPHVSADLVGDTLVLPGRPPARKCSCEAGRAAST